MFDFFEKIGTAISNFFGFIQDCIDGVVGFVDALKSWWAAAMSIINALPSSIVAIILVAFGLLVAFIVVELTRDYL